MLRDRTSPIFVIFCTGLMAECILPWAVIGLSDMFSFDVPGWSLWLLFGGPPVLSLLAMLRWALRTRPKQLFRARGHLQRSIARLLRSPGRHWSSWPRS
jgi:hypothetical protein